MYEVKTNHCCCHPETCCCNPYVVVDTDRDKRVATFFTIKGAQSLASKLNAADAVLKSGSSS